MELARKTVREWEGTLKPFCYVTNKTPEKITVKTYRVWLGRAWPHCDLQVIEPNQRVKVVGWAGLMGLKLEFASGTRRAPEMYRASHGEEVLVTPRTFAPAYREPPAGMKKLLKSAGGVAGRGAAFAAGGEALKGASGF